MLLVATAARDVVADVVVVVVAALAAAVVGDVAVFVVVGQRVSSCLFLSPSLLVCQCLTSIVAHLFLRTLW